MAEIKIKIIFVFSLIVGYIKIVIKLWKILFNYIYKIYYYNKKCIKRKLINVIKIKIH